MPTIRVLHDDALAALRGMEDASIDAVVTDPPYGLSNTDPKHVAETLTKWVTGDHEYTPSSPRKGRKNCLTEIVRGQEGDAHNTHPEAREDFVHRSVTVDRSLAVMLGTVDLDDHASVGEVEVDHVSSALALDDVLVHNTFAHLGQRGEDVEFRLWARQGAARCVGECACFAELSTSVARVGVRLGYYTTRYPEGTAPVVTLRTTEVRAMLSFDCRRGAVELTPAGPADEVDLFTLVIAPKPVGAGAGARSLPAVPQPDGVGSVDGAADGTFSLDLLAHETLLDRCFRPKDTPVGFMGKTWDSFVPPPAVWAECMRVLKPGGHLLVFAGTRTQDLMGLSIRLAGFDMRETLMWLYGSGMPKSIDLERSLAARGEDQVAAEFTGWASGLKPAYEPVIAARKPFTGSLTANVAKHGVGGYNINATRVATANGEVNPSISRRKGATTHLKHGTPAAETEAQGLMASRTSPERYAEQRPGETKGRWPTNVLLDPDAAAVMDAQSGTSTSRKGKPRKSAKPGDGYGMTHTGAEYDDSGGASRFFPVFKYQAKAPTSERPRVPKKMLRLRGDLTPEQVDYVRARLAEAGVRVD